MLLACWPADGSLSNNGRHIIFTSKDDEQLMNFMKALGVSVKIGKTRRRDRYGKREAGRVQFGDVLFYQFFLTLA